MVDGNLVVNVILFAISLVSAFFGIRILKRCKGKLKIVVLSLIVIFGFFIIYYLIKILDLIDPLMNNLATIFLHSITIIATLFVLIIMNQIIEKV